MLHVDPSCAVAEATPAEPCPAEQRRAARALVERQMTVLSRLTEIGLEIAEEAGRRATGPQGDEPSHDPGLTYTRVARAVRLTIALQTRLAKDLAGLGRDETAARRRRAHRLVARAIEAATADADEIEDLSDRAWERLREDEDLDAVAGRSLGEVVARICADLGLPEAAWANAFQVAEAPGDHPSPLILAEVALAGASRWTALGPHRGDERMGLASLPRRVNADDG